MSRKPLRLTMLAGTALSTSLLAQTVVAQEENVIVLEPIRIQAPASQSVLGNDEITQEQIEARNPASTREVFAGESSVTTGGGAAIAQKVFVNGIEESLLSVTIDGARQNKSAFHHTGNVLLDPELLKSVGITKGLAPADAGPGALAGSIAYETKDADDLLEEGDPFGGLFTLGTTSNGTKLDTSLSLFGRSGSLEYLLSATRRTGDDYEDGDGNEVLGTQADLTDFVGKFAYESLEGHRLEFAASRTEDTGLRAAQAGPGGILFIRPDFSGITSGPSVLAEGLSRRTSYTLTYNNTQPAGQWDPTFQLSHNEQEIDAIGVYGTNKSLSGTFKNSFAIAGGSVTAGLDFFRETAEGEGRGPGPFGSSGKEELNNIGLFAQARQDLGDRFSVSYGARFDSQDFTAADGTEFSDNGLSVNGAVDVVLSDTWSLTAGLASSWGGYELGEAALVNFGTAWDYTGFAPSRATSGRIGLRYDNGPWKVSAALFQTKVKDIAAVLPTDGARGALSDLTSRGFDASAEYNWLSGFARVNWTYADVELNEAVIGTTDYYLGRPVGHVIALEGGWTIDTQWRVGGTAEIALENDDAATVLPAYEVFNVYAAYRPRNIDNLEIRLDVQNLLDATYQSRSSDGVGSTRVIALNEPGRTFGLTARLRF
ncbi:TonB-dependent receptor domain-containing protein [Tritonibacter horizontis]|uniref:Heme transporter BhuA n=1 Tax=Tritonibacter horizontis TaxID=1768241 RepID=A0A132BTY3_9RHOB|nr:TonB-dependent receptor [Tritonibacter horizontis]KUP91823.1 heme transporter BhuA precursor [Tritonibacter horizontis]